MGSQSVEYYQFKPQGICSKRVSQGIKSQNSSTKLQINLKLKYSMTKTFISLVLLRLPMSVGDDAIVPTVDGLFVWPASSSSVVS